MKLYFSVPSPYVRKVMVVAIECGLAQKIEKIPSVVWTVDSDVIASNPLGKVPTLTLDDGLSLYDSPVICEYLDDLAKGGLFPPPGAARWLALRAQALGDGVMDAAVTRIKEQMRADGEKSVSFIALQKAKVESALDIMEGEADHLGDGVSIGHIAYGAALGYLDLRFADDDWRGKRPALADWYDTFSNRKSMMETVPEDPK